MDFNGSSPFPEGVISFLDTDLYKLTMQCAVLKYFSDVHVTYAFTNRTSEKKLSRVAFTWLETQIHKLGNIALSPDELRFLKSTCTYLNQPYLEFLQEFRLRPREQIKASFIPDNDTGSDSDVGEFKLEVQGLWVDTILYEIPLLALTSEAYFRFMDTEWTYDGQEEKAYEKGMKLLEAGCVVSEFGTRRRRDYHTQALVFRGLVKAKKEGERLGLKGKISGTSNVHLAMRFGIPPIGTVAHEWYMGIAAITGDYENANENALSYWAGCFGEGVLSVALTDTFGTPAFLKAFGKKMLPITIAKTGAAATSASAIDTNAPANATLTTTEQPLSAPLDSDPSNRTYAESYQGLRQDSGDPLVFIETVRKFYEEKGIPTKGKVLVFSDSISSIEQCIKYKEATEAAGFTPTFGIGTWMTNDFTRTSDGKPSTPINIVIKVSSANGNPAIKLSDDMGGKGTGDKEVVAHVKSLLGYVEKSWEGGDERSRWGR